MHRKKRVQLLSLFVTVFFPLIIAALFTACGAGGGGGNTVSNSTNNDSSSAIGSNGGTVASSDGKVKVVIPAGALNQATDITVSTVFKPPAGNIGTAYEFGPDGTIFSKPVTISINYDKASLPSGVNESYLKIGTINNNQWEIVADSTVDTVAGVVSIPTTHLSTYGVLYIGNADIHPGSMLTARNGHTATLLSNGKVLIAGGDDSSWYTTTSAELYDPATGIFKAIGSMTTPRDSHTATLLPSGKVLITGGFENSGTTLSSMEQYDPATDTFTDTGSMTTARYLHTATLLPSGKILIAGGYDEDDNPLSSAELYDPATDTFTPTSRMAPARAGHTATLLSNGKVLIAGGWNDSKNSAFSSAELYDPAKGTFTSIGNMLIARDGHTATLLSNGKVLIAGGGDITDAYSSAELYDPATNAFSVTGSMSTSRDAHTATLLSNGKVIILGGYNSKSDAFSSAELYDPSSGKFTAINSMVSVSITPESASVSTGGKQTFTAKVTGSSNTGVTWSVKEGASGGTITDGGAYTAPLTGGTFHVVATSQADPNKSAAAAIDVAEVSISINTKSVSVIKGGSQGFSATVTGTTNTKVAWSIKEGAGGGTIINTTSGVVYTAPMTTGTYHLVATSQADPSKSAEVSIDVFAVLVTVSISPKSTSVAIGGSQTFSATVTGATNTKVTWSIQEGASGGAITSGGVYTAPLTAGTYHVIATSQADFNMSDMAIVSVLANNMTTARYLHTATLLFNGKVLLAGGEGFDYILSDAELYDPVSSTFSAAGSMADSHVGHTATLLSTGKVLIADQTNSIAELYDPTTGTFTATGTLTTGYMHTATLLLNGKALLIGGIRGSDDIILSSAELYDPVNGTFTANGSMNTARMAHTATLLSNGKVLISGGADYHSVDFVEYNITNSAELYDPVNSTFTAIGNMIIARGGHTATLLPNGKVLLSGGIDTKLIPLSSAELYDPTTGTFTATNNMVIAHGDGHTATLLSNGKVLIAGGGDMGELPIANAELYDPTTGTFTTTGNMTKSRVYHTATLLPNGKVLITGGKDKDGSPLTSVELYDPATGTFE